MTHPLTLKVNGRTQEFVGSPMTRLLDVLRETLRLTGTKEGCGEGECGSCTVLMDGDPVCACLVPVFQAVGREIVTVEHLAQQSSCAPLIDGLVSEGGIQCGACTPGIVV